MLGDLIVWWALSSLILITMNSGTVHDGSYARFPTKPTEKLKIEKMYAIKQIKICAEYRDMLPRPRLDLSGTPGLRPIGLRPGSWQTSLGLGSMSRYSAQILICITILLNPKINLFIALLLHVHHIYNYVHHRNPTPRFRNYIPLSELHNDGCTDRSIYIQFLHQCHYYTEKIRNWRNCKRNKTSHQITNWNGNYRGN